MQYTRISLAKRLGKLFDHLWLPLYVLFSVSWLFAPALHNVHYGSLAVISHYEAIDQSFNWLFRVCDVSAALVLGLAVWRFKVVRQHRGIALLLCVVALCLAVDGLFAVGCDGICTRFAQMSGVVHDVESAVLGVAIFVANILALKWRRHWMNIIFLSVQLLFALLYVSSLVSFANLMVIQFMYELAMIGWLTWLVSQFAPVVVLQEKVRSTTRRLFFVWTLISGVLSLLLAATYRHIFGPVVHWNIQNQQVFLSQHSVIAGLLLLYIARQVLKGQRRAALLLAVIFVSQAVHYALFQPHPLLLAISLLSFVLLWYSRSAFTRNSQPLPIHSRFKDLSIVLLGVLFVAALMFSLVLITGKQKILYKDFSRAYVQHQSFLKRHERRVSERAEKRLRGVLDTLGIGLGVLVLWSLFRPSAMFTQTTDTERIRARDILNKYSNSSEDFFKLWPRDKQYFFNADRSGCVAYKVTGSVVFALADPISNPNNRSKLLAEFVDVCHQKGRSVCFLLINEESKKLYQSKFELLKVGSSALIDVAAFSQTTVREKWWRWQANRASKDGFRYEVSAPPHSATLVAEMRGVSNAWLQRSGHQEQSFALGYFDEAYLQQTVLHLLRDKNNKLIAFTNELPLYGKVTQRTVDLIRFMPEVNGAMPVLMMHVLQSMHAQGVQTFDLGFVPLAKLNSRFSKVARLLARGRFSAAGLEQFKGKFRPNWQPTYIAYDGDVIDLAILLANLDNVLKVSGE